MGRRRDAVLGLLTLAGLVLLQILTDTAIAPLWAALGAVGTILFEIIGSTRRTIIRDYWDRPAVQITTFVSALAVAAIGAILAPEIVLSSGIGALSCYLVILGGVSAHSMASERT